MAEKDSSEGQTGPAWKNRAVTRSLSAARSRIEERIQRFLDAARQLIEEEESSDFTIQQVVERSSQSLRSFYQYFDSKDELLFAVFEEIVSETIDALEAAIEDEQDPLDRLRAFTICLHNHSSPNDESKRSDSRAPQPIPELCWNLALRDPNRVARVMAPISQRLTELVEAAAAAGQIKVRDARHAAVLVQQTVMCGWVLSRMTSRPDSTVEPETAWDYCLRGLAG